MPKMRYKLVMVTIIVVITSIIICGPSESDGQHITDGDMEYFIYPNGTASFSDYTGSEKEITIPDKIVHDGAIYTVTTFSYNSLHGTKVTNITLPSTLVFVRGGFLEAEYLETIYISDSNDHFKTVDGVLFPKDGSMNRYYSDSVIDSDLILFPQYIDSSFISGDFQIYMKKMGFGQMNVIAASVDGGIITDGKLSVTFYYTEYDDFIEDYTIKNKLVQMTYSGEGSTMATVPVGIPTGLSTVYSASTTFTSNGVSNVSGAVFC